MDETENRRCQEDNGNKVEKSDGKVQETETKVTGDNRSKLEGCGGEEKSEEKSTGADNTAEKTTAKSPGGKENDIKDKVGDAAKKGDKIENSPKEQKAETPKKVEDKKDNADKAKAVETAKKPEDKKQNVEPVKKTDDKSQNVKENTVDPVKKDDKSQNIDKGKAIETVKKADDKSNNADKEKPGETEKKTDGKIENVKKENTAEVGKKADDKNQNVDKEKTVETAEKPNKRTQNIDKEKTVEPVKKVGDTKENDKGKTEMPKKIDEKVKAPETAKKASDKAESTNKEKPDEPLKKSDDKKESVDKKDVVVSAAKKYDKEAEDITNEYNNNATAKVANAVEKKEQQEKSATEPMEKNKEKVKGASDEAQKTDENMNKDGKSTPESDKAKASVTPQKGTDLAQESGKKEEDKTESKVSDKAAAGGKDSDPKKTEAKENPTSDVKKVSERSVAKVPEEKESASDKSGVQASKESDGGGAKAKENEGKVNANAKETSENAVTDQKKTQDVNDVAIAIQDDPKEKLIGNDKEDKKPGDSDEGKTEDNDTKESIPLNNKEGEKDPKEGGLPARWIMAILGCVGFMIVYGLKVNLSVAIIAMVNHTALAAKSVHHNDHAEDDHHGDNTTSENACGVEEKEEDLLDGPFDWDENIQGVILASYFYGYLFTQVPGGWVAEKFSAKHVFGVGALANAVLALLTPVAAKGSYIWLIVIRVGMGIAGGVTLPGMHCLIANWAPPQERSKIASTVYAGMTLGTLVCMPFSGLLAAAIDWSAIFYVQGGLSLLWYILWIIFVYDSPAKHPRISVAERKFIEESMGTVVKTEKPPVPWKSVWTSMPVWAIIVAHTCGNWGWYMLLVKLPTYMRYILKFDIKENAGISAVPFLCMWFFTMALANILDALRAREKISTTFARKLSTLIASIPPAICLIGVTYVGCNTDLAVVLLTLGTMFVGGMYSGYLSNHIDIAPPFAGTLMGISNTFATLPGIVVPSFVGYMTHGNQTVEAWRTIFFITLGIFGLEVVFYTIFASGEEQPWAKSKPRSDPEEQKLNDAL